MRCVLGIDSGGTKCDALVVREDGTAIGWGHLEYANSPYRKRNFGGFGRNHHSVGRAVRQALEGICCEHLYIGGTISTLPAHGWNDEQIGCLHLQVVMEQDAAYALAETDSGLVALAGTGAFVHGRTHDGREKRLDGQGPMVADYGSAYHLGALAMRAAIKSRWHPRHETSLQDAVFNALKERFGDLDVVTIVELMNGEQDRAEVAALARLVDEEARKGDRIANILIEVAANAIAETVRDLVDVLEINGEAYPLIGVGSVITKSDLYWQHFCTKVAEFAPELQPIRPTLPQVAGSVLAVLPKIASVDMDTARANLSASLGEMVGSA